MLRYGTYIFGGDDSLYVVVDDGACLVPQPDRTNAKCVFRVIGVDISSLISVLLPGLCLPGAPLFLSAPPSVRFAQFLYDISTDISTDTSTDISTDISTDGWGWQ